MVIICSVCQKIVPKVDAYNLCDQCGGYDKSTILPNYYHLWQVDGECSRCTFPLHVGRGQDIRFCPNCVSDQVTSQRGMELLRLAKKKYAARLQAKRDAEITDEFEKSRGEDESPSWPEGMAM